MQLRAVHKRRPQSERGRKFVQCGYFADKRGWFFRCRCPHLLAQKTSDFSKII